MIDGGQREALIKKYKHLLEIPSYEKAHTVSTEQPKLPLVNKVNISTF
jgi:hypothetical protein